MRGRPRFFIVTSVQCSGLPSDTQRLHGRLLSQAVWAKRHAPQALAVLVCASWKSPSIMCSSIPAMKVAD